MNTIKKLKKYKVLRQIEKMLGELYMFNTPEGINIIEIKSSETFASIVIYYESFNGVEWSENSSIFYNNSGTASEKEIYELCKKFCLKE